MTGALHVVNQMIQVGKIRAGQTVAIDIDQTSLRALDPHEEPLTVVTRINTEEVNGSRPTAAEPRR